MHLDVCLYVENYVLIGLDWVEPMIQFFLHITYTCIFHAYVPFLFYLLVLCFDGAFLLLSFSLSLSLSFSLSDSLHMAPKRKSAPSRNPIRFRASSSDPTPLHVRFHHDEKARQDFLENFSKRGIHSERRIILSDFSNTTLPTVIHSWG